MLHLSLKRDFYPVYLLVTYLRSCKRSFALSIVINEVVAAGIMIIGVRDPIERYIFLKQIKGNFHQTFQALAEQLY